MRDRKIFIDMFGDFHTQFAYMKSLFRMYWTDVNNVGLADICNLLKRKSIKKECKVYFDGEELFLHIFQGFVLSMANKVIKECYPQFLNSNTDDVAVLFDVARMITDKMRVEPDDPKVLFAKNRNSNKTLQTPDEILKRLVEDIAIFFYFKQAIRTADGCNVLRSLKFLFIRFLGKFIIIRYLLHFAKL